jgi:hypothetical protein
VAGANDVRVLLGESPRQEAGELSRVRLPALEWVVVARRVRHPQVVELGADHARLIARRLELGLLDGELVAQPLEPAPVLGQLLRQLAQVLLLEVGDVMRDPIQLLGRSAQLRLQELAGPLCVLCARLQVLADEVPRELVRDVRDQLGLLAAVRDAQRVDLDRPPRIDDARQDRLDGDVVAHHLDALLHRRVLFGVEVELVDDARQVVAGQDQNADVVEARLLVLHDRGLDQALRNPLRLDQDLRLGLVDRRQAERNACGHHEAERGRDREPQETPPNDPDEIAQVERGLVPLLPRWHDSSVAFVARDQSPACAQQSAAAKGPRRAGTGQPCHMRANA